MKRLTLDIETTGEFLGNGDFSNLELTVACVHDSESGEILSFYQDELIKLWPLIERVDMLVGYNSDHFDIPILNRYYPGNLGTLRSLDLLKEVKAVLGRRLRLDNLAEATLGKRKTGKGSDAMKWWEQGLREKVRDYCIEDVRITNALYEHARKHGILKYRDFDGVREIKIDTSLWEAPSPNGSALTYTLPF